MSQSNPPSASLPTEPPELVAEREVLLLELEKQARAATGAAQAVLRKLHEVVVHTKPNVPMDLQLYEDAKAAFERFMKEPVLPPPSAILQTIEFLQKRAVAMGWTGQMQLPKGAPPPPPGLIGSLSGSAPAQAPAAKAAPPPSPKVNPAGGAKDGFEGSSKPQSVDLRPSDGTPVSVSKDKEDLKSESSTRLKNPGAGNLRG
ncbi:hypothetical protein [Stigmatella aurantiaca]|uniref:Conserved uncharacterized protein n=1 Tax=Stigmatella aurantiaca (strain DW4/3-1) TaxID=378806 RepID=E3FM03_STIAD|nr:hypothetical protein [Stigmatella aurantiaca]ADO68007.1 conserved uncharacterized protein [Stigmatella aurantiaca DW4/3-1]